MNEISFKAYNFSKLYFSVLCSRLNRMNKYGKIIGYFICNAKYCRHTFPILSLRLLHPEAELKSIHSHSLYLLHCLPT